MNKLIFLIIYFLKTSKYTNVKTPKPIKINPHQKMLGYVINETIPPTKNITEEIIITMSFLFRANSYLPNSLTFSIFLFHKFSHSV